MAIEPNGGQLKGNEIIKGKIIYSVFEEIQVW